MKKKSTKLIVLLLAVALLFGCAVGGTLAWLMTATAPVVNTFTVGNINITLAETTSDYKMIPGGTIAKDPKVTVKAGSEDCYLFVKIEEAQNTFMVDGVEAEYIDYTVADDWKPVPGVTDTVYYRTVSNITEDMPFPILLSDQVTVNNKVTKIQIDAIEKNEALRPKLTFTAYAIQSDNIEGANEDAKVATAWSYAKDATPPASGS